MTAPKGINGETIRQLRRDRYTQSQIADMLGCSTQTVKWHLGVIPGSPLYKKKKPKADTKGLEVITASEEATTSNQCDCSTSSARPVSDRD